MSSFLSKIMDSALEARVSDSNERLEEYLQGALRSNALESFALVAPHRDGYRVYVGEDVERPFAYVDVYLDGESLIVEGSSKRHLSEDEMGDLARFLGIDGKEAGMKLNRFRRFVDALRSMSGSDVDALRELRVSDCVLKEVRRTKVEDAGKTWPEVYLERLRSVPVPEGRGSLSEEEKERILDQRIQVALSSIVSFLSDRGYRTSLDDLDITVEGADGKAYLHLNGMDRGNGFLSINIGDDPKTHYHDVVSVDAWFSLLKASLGDRISDSQEPGEGFKIWADSESDREVPAELDIVYATADEAYDVAVNFVHSFDGADFRVIVHVSSLSDEFEGDIVESFPKGSDAYREVYLGGIEDSTGGRRADSASSSLHLGDTVLLSNRADEPYRSSEFKIVDMNPALGLAGLMREGDSHIYPAPISELSLVSEQEVKNVPAGMLKDSVESDAELLESLRSDSSPANLKRVAHILKDQGRTSLKDGSKEVMAIAEYSNGQLVYSYKQKAWQEVQDSLSEGGVSTTKAGEEKYEKFTTRVGRKSRTMYQYDYRTPDGELFSCVAPSLEACRMHRDSWLEKRGVKIQDDDHFRDAKGTIIMLEDRVRVLNPTTNNTDFIGDFGVVEGLDDDGYIHVQLDNIDRPLMFDSREVVVINRKEGDSETMRIFGKDYKKGDTLVDSDGVKARIMYRDGNDAVVLTEEDNKWYRLPIRDSKDVIKKVSDAMDPNEDKDENIHVNWKISDMEKYLRKPASKRRGKKVEDSKPIDKNALGEWLVGAADRAINSFGDGTVYYKDLGDGHSIVLDWIEGYDNDENNPFVKEGYGLEASLRKTKSSFFVGEWEYAYDDSSISLEGSDKEDNGERVIDYLMSFKEEKVEDSKELPRRDFVFPADSTMVNDGKGHFPLNSLSRGRAALAFVARYDRLPKWYSGDMSLEEFKDHVRSEVKKAYPSIEVSDSAESGSGSFDFNEVYHDLDVALQKTRHYLNGKDSESMTDADWGIATVGSAISRAMRYLHEAARKQGQTTDYTNVKDDCKVYDAKESTEDMWARICEADEITEREINLLSRRLNAEGRDTLDYDLRKNRYDLALTDEQERKALAWLNNQWKTSTGKERKNNPFGYREEQILDRATDVTFVQFYNAGNRYIDNFIPVYRVYSNDGSFEYYVQGGEISIVG